MKYRTLQYLVLAGEGGGGGPGGGYPDFIQNYRGCPDFGKTFSGGYANYHKPQDSAVPVETHPEHKISMVSSRKSTYQRYSYDR